MFLLVTPSNYKAPRIESSGAPISTINVYAVLTFIVPITRSFLTGIYCTGKRIKDMLFVFLTKLGMPA